MVIYPLKRMLQKNLIIVIVLVPLEKVMAPHSSTLAWKIPWMEEPGRLQSMGLLSRTPMSDFNFTFHFHALEKEMAPHSKCSCLENPRDGVAWWAAIYGVAQNRTRLKRLSSSSSSSDLSLRAWHSSYASWSHKLSL